MDALSEVLRTVRMKGALNFDASLPEPWGIRFPKMNAAVFHFVSDGRAFVELPEHREARALETGDFIVLPSGTAHVVTSRRGVPSITLSQHMRRMHHDPPNERTTRRSKRRASMVCGRLELDADQQHPLRVATPPLIHVRADSGRAPDEMNRALEWLQRESRADGTGSDAVVSRLAEILFIGAMREYVRRLPDGDGEWLRGLTDPRISTAMGLMHRRPDTRWSVERLAQEVGMSRSAFVARFRDLVGEPPHAYLTRVRIQEASRLLRNESITVKEIASRVGYSAAPSFTKVFRRITGQTPHHYRRDHRH